MTTNKSLRGSLMLILTALIWGTAFVAQSAGMDYVEPFTFNCIRSLIGSAALLPVIYILDKRNPAAKLESKTHRKTLIIGGVSCGLILFAATMLQQFGLKYTSAGKAGFITALYIIIVPILGILFKKLPHPIILVCVAIATVGMYLLCVNEKLSIGTGDLYVMCCAFLFAIHIIVIDYFAPKVDGVKMSCIQFFVSGIISLVIMFIFEQPAWTSIWEARVPILYTGIMSSGVAYTLQIVAQGSVEPVLASLLMSLESVFAALAGWLILKERLSLKEFIGCLMIFAAVLLAQTPPLLRKRAQEHKSVKKAK